MTATDLWLDEPARPAVSKPARNGADRFEERLTERIRRVRKLAGLTQAEFARALGVTRGAVGNWERGLGINRENLARIAEKTGASFDWLATGRGEEPPAAAVAKPAGNGADRFDARLTMLMSSAFERLGHLPSDEARNLAVALIEAARTPPDPQESVPEADQLRLIADALARFVGRK